MKTLDILKVKRRLFKVIHLVNHISVQSHRSEGRDLTWPAAANLLLLEEQQRPLQV